jgi:hypothetical protein
MKKKWLVVLWLFEVEGGKMMRSEEQIIQGNTPEELMASLSHAKSDAGNDVLFAAVHSVTLLS